MPIGEAEGFKGMVDLIQDKAYSYENRKRTEIPVPAEWDGYIEKLRGELNEVVAETSEELMEKFFAGEKFTDAEFKEGIKPVSYTHLLDMQQALEVTHKVELTTQCNSITTIQFQTAY